MSDVIDIPTQGEGSSAPLEFVPRERRRWFFGRRRRNRPPKPRVRKLRLLLILIGLGALALVSTVFGMMMAVASDLPQIENRQQYAHATNSYLYDDHWRPIGLFTPPNNVVIDRFQDISWSMRRAIVAVEDRRFWTSSGVDIKGIARAFVSDVTGGPREGASTIAQQFVKNTLAEQGNRTVFEKLREAAMAYHLTREWSKEKILTQYLNSIYFGNGAYGIESAARVYFGYAHGYRLSSTSGTTDSAVETDADPNTQPGGCGDDTQSAGETVKRPKCAFELEPWESALLAGMVASPTAFNPIAHPGAARVRRNLVLKDMWEQHYITRAEYVSWSEKPLPTAAEIQQPSEPTAAPYFTSWLRPQILSAMARIVPTSVATYRAYYGGLKIRTTLDLEMQKAAQEAITAELPPGSDLPTASLVAIDNKTGEVRAMVGGLDYAKDPFNVATDGRRQPGSAFKPFTLAVALESGYGPDSLFTSAPANFIVPNSRGKEHFPVRNFGNSYSGTSTLANATAFSDNSVYARLGIDGLGKNGTKRIAKMAHRMGITTPVSTNYAMILGGLKIGVSPLEMAHAYETFATGGLRVYNPKLGGPGEGPTGIAQINCPAHVCGNKAKAIMDDPSYKRILPPQVAATVHEILSGVVKFGTATSAQISGVDVVGKTGTTSNYGDAWFVGWTPQLTTAVWVGYPDKLVPMNTQYNGEPVEGGTYPAIIWQNFMTQALQILAAENPKKSIDTGTSTSAGTGSTGNTGTGNTGTGSPSDATGTGGTGNTGTGGAGTANGGGATGATNAPNGGGTGNTGAGGGTTGAGTGGGGGTTGGGTTGGAGGTTGAGGGSTGGGTGGAGLGGGGGGGNATGQAAPSG
jgi:penicillin-binding protein 1A